MIQTSYEVIIHEVPEVLCSTTYFVLTSYVI